MLHLSLRRASLAVALITVALAAGGCTHTQISTDTTTTAAVHQNAAEQVMTTCVNNLFQNGMLPLAPSKAECVQCIITALGQIGLTQRPGESANTLIATVRSTASQSSELNNACNEADVSD